MAAITDAEFELVAGGGGIFDIEVDGVLRFSKKSVGRFPTEAELDEIAAS